MAQKDEEWDGPERRIEQDERRSGIDRRTGIRWEPGKDDRRSGTDRRRSRQDVWKDHQE